ncbi:MAG: folate-binding protein YgfZ [Acidobacteria bacterium]|nr:folate-binding protein YgfZ [Acidobacteriota bacterium]
MSILTEKDQAPADERESFAGLAALTTSCGIYKVDRTLVSLTGQDRVRWLNGMVTNNVRDLAANQGVYAFVLSPQGHILGDLYIFNRSESLALSVERSQRETLVTVLGRYIIMDKVEIDSSLASFAALAIAGPKSEAVLDGLGVHPKLNSLQLADTRLEDFGGILVRGDNPCVPNYEFWMPNDQLERAWKLLLGRGAVEVQAESLEMFRILCGIPKVGKDIRERTLPQETGQERALNFNKGCYIGQEIVERIRSRGAVHRTLVGLEIEGEAPIEAGKIESQAKDVGELTSVARAPIKGKRIALGYVRKEFLGTDQALAAQGRTVKPRPLPFMDLFN